jgi:hypothetical protein
MNNNRDLFTKNHTAEPELNWPPKRTAVVNASRANSELYTSEGGERQQITRVLHVGPRASRIAMRAHNRKIPFSPCRYLNLLDLHSLETLAEWTGKAAILVSLWWAGCSCHATVCGIRLRDAQERNGALVSSHT